MIQTFIDRLNMKENEVYEKNYISCLNWLSYWYQENKVQEAKQNNKSNKIA